MPRCLVQRTWPDGLDIPATAEGAAATKAVNDVNLSLDVAWVQSYVSADKSVTYCIYGGPAPERIRAAAEQNNLPVDQIIEVRVLDPYFYH